jgi:hypothetical protein
VRHAAHQEDIPCDNWALLGSETSPRGYRYRDPELDQGTAKSIVWKPGRLRLTLAGGGPTVLGVDLTPGVPVSSPVEVTMLIFNGSYGYCVTCSPFDGRDGSDGKTFLGKSCSAPPICIASPSGAFVD